MAQRPPANGLAKTRCKRPSARTSAAELLDKQLDGALVELQASAANNDYVGVPAPSSARPAGRLEHGAPGLLGTAARNREAAGW